jgi:hypothetical protein
MLEPFSGDYTPYTAPMAQQIGEIHTDVLASYGRAEMVELVVYGNDPWFTAPTATLQSADGTTVARAGGKPLNSDGQAFAVHFRPEPSYKDDPHATSRAFLWTFDFPIQRRVTGATPNLDAGDYRLEVAIPDGDGGTSSVVSGTFAVTDG